MAIKLSVPGAFAQPFVETTQVAVANAGRDGTGTTATVHAGSTNGSVLAAVDIAATVTTTAGMVRFYFNNGTTTRLIGEVAVSAITVSGTVPGFSTTWTPPGGSLTIPNGCSLLASTQNAEAINLTARGVDY